MYLLYGLSSKFVRLSSFLMFSMLWRIYKIFIWKLFPRTTVHLLSWIYQAYFFLFIGRPRFCIFLFIHKKSYLSQKLVNVENSSLLYMHVEHHWQVQWILKYKCPRFWCSSYQLKSLRDPHNIFENI